MRILIDTHIFLWLIDDIEQLTINNSLMKILNQ